MNPFKYGKAVSGYQFYDRERSCAELYQTLNDGSANVVLYAPRRYGKTSLVLRVLERFRSEGIKCVYFDFSRVNTIERFCTEYTAAVYSLWGGIPELINKFGEYLVHLHPKFTFVDSPIPQITFDYGRRMNALNISEVLELPEKLSCDRGNEPVVVAFDEFQDVSGLSREIPLEAVFRSVIQSQKNVRYVFLGSKTHLIKRMFGLRTRPFYKSAHTMKIDKPPREDSERFVVSHFEGEDISISPEVLNRLMDVSENIPYFLQAISSLAYQSVVCRKGDSVEIADLDYAIERFMEGNEDYYAEIVRNLAGGQLSVVEALAKAGSTSTISEQFRTEYTLGSLSSVHSSLRGLINKGVVDSVKGEYVLTDPFFAKFIRER